MKKLAIAVGSAIFVTVAMAIPALADSSIPKPHDPSGGTGPTAFTGATGVGHATTLLVVLVVMGVSALTLAFLHRRNSAA